MARSTEKSNSDPAVQALNDIKLLLIASLLKDGVKQADVAALLGVSTGKLSGMLPKGERSFRAKGSS